MKHLMLFILILLPSLSARADKNNFNDGAGFCTQCSHSFKSENPASQQLQNFEDIAQLAGKSISEINDTMKFGETCDKFADENGLGQWGSFIIEEMDPDVYSCLYEGTDDLIEYCPNFPNLENEERELVFVAIFNALGNFESTCNQKAKARGPHGRAAGIFQLHQNHEHAAAAFPRCQNGDGQTLEGSLRCGISILNAQFCFQKSLFGTTEDFHFAAFRTNLKKDKKYLKMQKVIREFGLCKLNK